MQDISDIFENRNKMMYKLSKERYEQNMEEFEAENGQLIRDLLSEVGNSEDREATLQEISTSCVEQIFAKFSKLGRIKKTIQMELELFMIYYLFPAILRTNDENAAVLCDSIRDGWNKRFKKNIDYTDYDTLLTGFVTKIFGMPVDRG